MGLWRDQIVLRLVFSVELFQVSDGVNISAAVAAVTLVMA